MSIAVDLSGVRLREAAERGDSAAVQLELYRGAEVDGTPTTARTALHRAADRGWVDIVALLIRHGADANIATSHSGETALHLAASRDHAECVRELLKAGGDPRLKNINGWTALHNAMYHNNVDVAKLLIRSGANPTELNNADHTAEAIAFGPERWQRLGAAADDESCHHDFSSISQQLESPRLARSQSDAFRSSSIAQTLEDGHLSAAAASLSAGRARVVSAPRTRPHAPKPRRAHQPNPGGLEQNQTGCRICSFALPVLALTSKLVAVLARSTGNPLSGRNTDGGPCSHCLEAFAQRQLPPHKKSHVFRSTSCCRGRKS